MGTINAIADAIRDEMKRQAPGVYFWDRSDESLFAGGKPELDEFEGGVNLADRFDLAAVAKAVLHAIREPTEEMLREASYYGQADIADTWDWRKDLWQAMIDKALGDLVSESAIASRPRPRAEITPAEQAVIHELECSQWFLLDELTDDPILAREKAKMIIPADQGGGFTVNESVQAKYAMAVKDGKVIMTHVFKPMGPGDQFTFTSFELD